jgi:hypothetical protein
MAAELDNNDFYDQMDEAMRTDIATKRKFFVEEVTFNKLFDFVTYEFCDGDSDKTCEKLAEFYGEFYDHYFADVVRRRWFVSDRLAVEFLFDFVTYEFFGKNSDKVYEKFAEYFNQEYNDYCDYIASKDDDDY